MEVRYNRINSEIKNDHINHEIKNNIGTIARSGTKNFLNQLENSNDLSLIGQFGVGFYSAFLVADKVKVITKKQDSDSIFEWESNGGSNFYLKEENSHSLENGTRIELYLK